MAEEELDTIPISTPHDKVSVPEGHPSDSPKNNHKRGNKTWAAVAFGALAIVIILCIVLPFTLSKPNEKKVDSLASNQSENETNPTNEAETEDASKNPIEELDNETQFQASSGVDTSEIKTDLPYFSSDITVGYQNVEDFDEAMTKAALLMVKRRAERNQSPPLFREPTGGNMMESSAVFGDTMAMPIDMPEAAPMKADSVGGVVTDFGTNNQEVGVDEADIIKADDKYIYAAYGDYIIVWDTTGNKVTQVAMPPLPRVYYDTYWRGGEPVMEEERQYYQPKARIQALMSHSGVLTVIVSGYGNMLRESVSTEPSILYEYLGTHIRTYRTSNLDETGELEFIGMKDINGRYLDARSIGSNIHIATVSGVDIYRGLLSHFDSNSKEKMTENLTELQNKIIPDFIRRLREDLFLGTDDFTKMLQINRWQTDSPDRGEIEDLLVKEDIASNVAWITSFDATAAPDSNTELSVSSSMFMSPSSWMHMYGTEEKLVLATQGWNWNAKVEGEQQTTYLLSLSVDGPTTNFISVGTVTGHLLNQFSLDIVGNDLRVATTVRTRWFNFPRPMPIIVDSNIIVDEEEAVAAEGVVETAVDDDEPAAEELEKSDQDVNFEADDVETSIAVGVPVYPVEVPVPIVGESSTENYVIVLELERADKPGQIVERGRVKIGEIHESITAVRFFDDIAYVVTFQRTDPFYVIDLKTPSKLGEFKLNGFSSYLHPMNSDNTLLIGIGQDATDEGRTTGLMITVFDATTPEVPIALVNYTLSDTRSGSSNSAVQWDHKAFRYIEGHLIIPVSEWHYVFNEETGEVEQHNFEGFSVFGVTTTSINEQFRVSMFDRHCHYCSGYLPQRSFVYDGNLMTVQNNNVKSTNLATGAPQWNVDIVVDGEDATCCPYYI